VKELSAWDAAGDTKYVSLILESSSFSVRLSANEVRVELAPDES
jgi:hypothetical protein